MIIMQVAPLGAVCGSTGSCLWFHWELFASPSCKWLHWELFVIQGRSKRSGRSGNGRTSNYVDTHAQMQQLSAMVLLRVESRLNILHSLKVSLRRVSSQCGSSSGLFIHYHEGKDAAFSVNKSLHAVSFLMRCSSCLVNRLLITYW